MIGDEEGCSSYNDGTQQDAGSLLLILLDLISEEIKAVTGTKSSFMDKFTSKQIISNNFTATDDGSCPLCGNPSEPMEQNVILFPLRASMNQNRDKSIQDLIQETL